MMLDSEYSIFKNKPVIYIKAFVKLDNRKNHE